ncbi:MAG: hypothetical protein IJW38_03180 [Clostridia bacterium]|nr:hypothetical protein [Clostridia bacterium]
MNWKKLGKALLFPHISIMLILIPVAAVFLVYSMVFLGTESPVAIISYVLAAYTLTVWCFKIPNIVKFLKTFKEKNKFMRLLKENPRLKLNISLWGLLAWNALYGVFQLWLGLYHKTFWFSSIGAYYICLGVMRFYLLLHTGKFSPGEKMYEELKKYRTCGWMFLLMNLALTLIVFFMLYWNRTFIHDMITAIAMAAYTFTAFTISIIDLVKYKKYNSPVFSASKAISLVAACVSMLTLTSTMLTAFSDGTMSADAQKFILGSVGFAASGVAVAMAIYMIVQSARKLRQLNGEVQNGE